MTFVCVLRFILVSALLFVSVSGHCLIPEVRREWRSISPIERASWINAVKCLAELPHDPKVVATVDPALSLIPPLIPNSSYFDDFSYAHMDLNVVVHGTGFFLPWHRLYVQTFEDELRSKCGYTGVQPYWDWTQDAADVYHSTIFSDSNFDGLGSWGDPDNDFQISTGGFKDIRVAYPVPHNIRRNYTLQPFLAGLSGFGSLSVDPLLMINTTFTKTVVDFTVNSFTGDYINFQTHLENIGRPHPGPHLILGGDNSGLCPFGLQPPACYTGMKWAPNDPMFYLHHTMVDKIWYDWQHRNSSNKNTFGGGSISVQVDPSQASKYPTGAPPLLNLSSVIPSDGLWESVTIGDVMDTMSGKLCYIYA
ncbi:Di-copper centre-containing protein [Thelephora ganbajun]|uniref:Di-copper centre-containing protein n=1 Tax=Thelephora ganbajun TaxID=370292 RepID=A0ACB6ZCG4_THEGA|nr:Di-copper centre-containing protein [Thelephora ganbajun]